MKKTIAVFLSAILMVGLCFCNTTRAEHYLDRMMSSSGTAGQWISDYSQCFAYSSNIYDHLCGGDMGVWFYTSQNGLPPGFKTLTSRRVYIEQYEIDPSSSTIANEYTGYFGTYDNKNVPVSYSCTYTNSSSLEDDGAVELYIKFKVTTNWGDSSNSVPVGLLYYRHWAL